MGHIPETSEYSDHKLACAVIVRAIKDFQIEMPRRSNFKTKKDFLKEFNPWEAQRIEAERFLIGKSDMSKFWFDLAGILFFSDSHIRQLETTPLPLVN